jgi:hypothetical protein
MPIVKENKEIKQKGKPLVDLTSDLNEVRGSHRVRQTEKQYTDPFL